MQKTRTICLIILTTIATGLSLYWLRTVLVPFVIALFVAIGCRPLLEYFERKLGFHRIVSFVLTFLLGCCILVGLGILVWASINELSRQPEAYEQRLTTIARWVAQQTAGWGESDGESAAVTSDDSLPGNGISDSGSADANSSLTASEQTARAVKDLTNALSSQLQTVLLNLAASLSSLLSYGVLILIFVFFLLLESSPAGPARPILLDQMEQQIRKYLVLKTVISFFTGLVFGLVLWFFGVPLATLFGMLAFVLNFIPNIGPLIANILPVPFLLLNSSMSPLTAVVCFVLISLVQFVSGNVVETRLMGKSFDVAPTVLLLNLMFFGLIWGVVGMFLATPVISIAKIALQQSHATRSLAELMAGRWTVTGTSHT
jgi:AI-2 transport protein TqsA